MGTLIEPFDEMTDVIQEDSIHIANLIQRYQAYLETNKAWLFKDAPRRSDMKLYEAIYHFNIYRYLFDLLRRRGYRILPEFPKPAMVKSIY